MGLSPTALRGQRVGAMKACGRAPRGASLDLRLRAHSMMGKSEADPMVINVGMVAFFWALAIWENFPHMLVLTKTLEAAQSMVKEFEQPWKQVVDPAQVFLLTMARAGMDVISATTLRMLSGETIKLDKLAPGMVKAPLAW